MPRGENAKAGKQGFQRTDPKDLPGAAGVNAGAGAPTTGPGGGNTETVDYDRLLTRYRDLEDQTQFAPEIDPTDRLRPQYRVDQLPDVNPAVYQQLLVRHYRRHPDGVGCWRDTADDVNEDLAGPYHQPGLSVLDANPDTHYVCLEGDFTLTDAEHAELSAILGRPAPRTLPLDEGNYYADETHWSHRINDPGLEDAYRDDDSRAALYTVMTQVRARLDALEEAVGHDFSRRYRARSAANNENRDIAREFAAEHQGLWFSAEGMTST